MGLGIWSLIAILYQSLFFMVLGWVILDCRFAPHSEELHEVTLMKLLYLYDPEACGRVHFYNYTAKVNNKLTTSVIWPVNNDVAYRFRGKIQVWLALHLIWAVLGVVNASQGSRPCSFYVTVLPFTVTGVALLVVDVVFASLFLADAKNTGTQRDILLFIENSGELRSVNTTLINPTNEDTTWISVLMAYISLRGVVQWIFNFWIVKDSYFEGLATYHYSQYQTTKGKLNGRNSIY